MHYDTRIWPAHTNLLLPGISSQIMYYSHSQQWHRSWLTNSPLFLPVTQKLVDQLTQLCHTVHALQVLDNLFCDFFLFIIIFYYLFHNATNSSSCITILTDTLKFENIWRWAKRELTVELTTSLCFIVMLRLSDSFLKNKRIQRMFWGN